MRVLSLLCLLVFLTSCDRHTGQKSDLDVGRGRSITLYVPQGLQLTHQPGDDIFWLSSGESVKVTVAVFERDTAERTARRHWNFMRGDDPNITPISEMRFPDGRAFLFSTVARGSRLVFAFRTFSDESMARCLAVAAYWPLSDESRLRPEFDYLLREMSVKTAAPTRR